MASKKSNWKDFIQFNSNYSAMLSMQSAKTWDDKNSSMSRMWLVCLISMKKSGTADWLIINAVVVRSCMSWTLTINAVCLRFKKLKVLSRLEMMIINVRHSRTHATTWPIIKRWFIWTTYERSYWDISQLIGYFEMEIINIVYSDFSRRHISSQLMIKSWFNWTAYKRSYRAISQINRRLGMMIINDNG